MKAILIRIVKTQKQEIRINNLIMSQWVTNLKVKPSLPNGNLHLQIFDEFGRDYYRELTPDGKLIRTLLHV